MFERLFGIARRRSAESASNTSATDGVGRLGNLAPSQLLDLGLQHHRAGRLDRAEEAYYSLLAADPDNADALHFLGVIAHQRGDHARALELIGQALARNEANAPAHNNLGNALLALGDPERAMASYRRAIEIAPDYTDARVNLGALLLRRASPEALECFGRLVALAPGLAAAHAGLADALLASGEAERAIESYRKALELEPESPAVRTGLGNALVALGRVEEAEAVFRRALQSRSDYAPAKLALALARLLQGDYGEGLALYESRLEPQSLFHEIYAPLRSMQAALQGVSRWQGEDLGGQTLLVWSDQGLGDTIMAARYLPLVKNRGAGRLIVYCAPAVARLLRGIAEVDEAISPEQGLPLGRFDCHCPVMSLPFVFRTRLETIPARVPYLCIPDEMKRVWAQRLGAVPRPRIALTWAGRRQNPRDRVRSVPFESLAPLLRIPGLHWISLQKESEGELMSANEAVRQRRGDSGDLLDTAALMCELDLIVSVDTAIAHLAGALGKPVWLLNAFESDWRWMRQREDSPWYPTMRIFRQRKRDDWDSVISAVAVALRSQYLDGRG